MTATRVPKDLLLLTADKNMEHAVRGILARTHSLRICEISFDIQVHPQRDPGCLREGHTFLGEQIGRYRHAIVMLDREGCGKERAAREALEAELEERLHSTGWETRAAAIVLDPELEIWVWSDSPEVEQALGWAGKKPDLRSALVANELLEVDEVKPTEPKGALIYALRKAGKPRSSAIYYQIARNVGLKRCTDPAFKKLLELLRAWFPAEETT